MANSTLKYDSVNGAVHGAGTEGSKGLGYEKLGVIAGFLAGLPVGIGLVDASLMSAGAPAWLGLVATLASVAACTALGLKAGEALAKRSGHGPAA